jgi:hypothetical protein
VVQAIQSEKEIYYGDSKKKHLPPFLDQNPGITTKIKQYCKENSGELSVEFLFKYLHNAIIPKMVHYTFGKQREELGEEQYQERLDYC